MRIILSGHADQEMARRSVGAAHQYLSKPCDADTLAGIDSLKQTVARACAQRGLLADESLRQLVSAPVGFADERAAEPAGALHRAAHRASVNQFPQSANTTRTRVGEIISQDVGMTAKILPMVNSAFFGLSRPLTSPVE